MSVYTAATHQPCLLCDHPRYEQRQKERTAVRPETDEQTPSWDIENSKLSADIIQRWQEGVPHTLLRWAPLNEGEFLKYGDLEARCHGFFGQDDRDQHDFCLVMPSLLMMQPDEAQQRFCLKNVRVLISATIPRGMYAGVRLEITALDDHFA